MMNSLSNKCRYLDTTHYRPTIPYRNIMIFFVVSRPAAFSQRNNKSKQNETVRKIKDPLNGVKQIIIIINQRELKRRSRKKLCAVNVFRVICHMKLDSIEMTHMHNEQMLKCYTHKHKSMVHNTANQNRNNGPPGYIKWQINVTATTFHMQKSKTHRTQKTEGKIR